MSGTKNLLRPDELAAIERVYAMCSNEEHDACTAVYLLAERLRTARYEASHRTPRRKVVKK